MRPSVSVDRYLKFARFIYTAHPLTQLLDKLRRSSFVIFKIRCEPSVKVQVVVSWQPEASNSDLTGVRVRGDLGSAITASSCSRTSRPPPSPHDFYTHSRRRESSTICLIPLAYLEFTNTIKRDVSFHLVPRSHHQDNLTACAFLVFLIVGLCQTKDPVRALQTSSGDSSNRLSVSLCRQYHLAQPVRCPTSSETQRKKRLRIRENGPRNLSRRKPRLSRSLLRLRYPTARHLNPPCQLRTRLPRRIQSDYYPLRLLPTPLQNHRKYL